ncbi:MAG: hypothetical protein D3923_17800 [Candidatus Electrothrix sp. AR3]|nr:hypothetical protein [Candidatus Electrothrix sp. AR3]
MAGVLSLVAIMSGFSYGDNAQLDDSGQMPENTNRFTALLASSSKKVSPWPFALLMAGIIAGTSSGILMRTHNVLGVISVEKQDDSFIKLQKELTELEKQEGTSTEQKGKWKGLDISLSDIAQRILDKYYPKGGVVNKFAATSLDKNKQTVGGLMAADAAPVCKELLSRPVSSWRSYIQMIDNDRFTGLDEIADDSKLEKQVHSICEQSSKSK